MKFLLHSLALSCSCELITFMICRLLSTQDYFIIIIQSYVVVVFVASRNSTCGRFSRSRTYTHVDLTAKMGGVSCSSLSAQEIVETRLVFIPRCDYRRQGPLWATHDDLINRSESKQKNIFNIHFQSDNFSQFLFMLWLVNIEKYDLKEIFF